MAVVFAAFCLLPAAFGDLPGLYSVIEIGPHIFLWEPEVIVYQTGDPQFSRSAAAGFIITSTGVVVVNTTNNPLNARDLLYEIRRHTDRPVKVVINTDWRGDHMLGNEVFADLEAQLVASSVAKVKMQEYQTDLSRRMKEDPRLAARMRGIHLTFPTQTFDPQSVMGAGAEEIRLLDVGQGALAGTAVVYLPDSKILFLGGLYDRGYIPYSGFSDLRAWIDTLRQVESMDAEIFVPDEGLPGDKNQLIEFREFLEWMSSQIVPSAAPFGLLSRRRLPRMARVQ